jgi:hypothetical protein
VSWSIFDDEEGGSDTRLTPEREAFLKACERDPLKYLYGVCGSDDHPVVRTKDTHDEENPIKPLPDWPYQRWSYLGFAGDPRFWTEQGMDVPEGEWARKFAVDKPRQVMISWGLVLWMDYNALFKPYRRCLLNKATEQEAEHMLFDRLGVVHKYWPEWFRNWAGCVEKKTTGTFEYGRTGSSISATGENVDDRAARGDQASIFGVDEAARHPRLREVVAALMPMAKQVILVSTPEAGTPGSQYMHEILMEEV